MAEIPAETSDPRHDLVEEMRYALRLAEEREQSARENIERLKRQFSAHYSRLEERAKAAEKNAERAEVEAAEAEARVGKSLQALRMLKSRLTSYAPGSESNRAEIQE
jgi:phenylpropionate dioxygenase-like ring-hydroxylating dioxygenase large terminal subunit